MSQVEEEEPTGFIRFEKFQPMMAKVLLERRFVGCIMECGSTPYVGMELKKNGLPLTLYQP